MKKSVTLSFFLFWRNIINYVPTVDQFFVFYLFFRENIHNFAAVNIDTTEMKKIVYCLAVALALVACNGKNTGKGAAADTTAVAADSDSTAQKADSVAAGDSLVFTGTLPAADCDGIRYHLALDQQKKHFTLKEDYMESADKVKDTFYEKGTVAEIAKDDKKALKLDTGTKGDELYFLEKDANTLTLVSEDLEESVTGGNYNLKLEK